MKDISHYKSLGVINRTPNSFSDQGLSLNPTYFKNQLQSFLEDPTVIIDIGFESTAPMNKAVSSDEEKNRFHEFLKEVIDVNFSNRFISFDTYKPENFLYMTREFKKNHPEASFIFNDVSGVLDEELMKVLSQFKGEDFYYVYTFTHIPSRSLVLDHMKYTDKNSNILKEVLSAFKKAYEFFESIKMESQLILDPGFGFSKTYEQNWELINHFGDFSESLFELGIKNTILIGLSKKSFLKKALGIDDGDKTEGLHLESLKKIKKASKFPLLFRVHDPKIILFL